MQIMITPAQSFLKQHQVPHRLLEYDCQTDDNFGKYAATVLGLDEQVVFKTIILHHDKTYVTCVVPVDGMISLKNAARLVKLKSLEMTDVRTAQNVTGFIVGGISPFGQKRRTLTILNSSALLHEEIFVSGGRRGLSVGIKPQDLVKALGAVVGDIMDHKDP